MASANPWHYQKSADNTAAWITDASYRPEQGHQQKSPSKSMEGNIVNTTCTKFIFDNPDKHIYPPTPRVITPTCSPVSSPTSDEYDVQSANNIDNKSDMLQSGQTNNGTTTMHHRIEHNNISNNNTIDTDMEQTEMNNSIKYIKSKENCTGNNPWANDTMEDVQEGIDQNKLNGYESANYLTLQIGDDVPVRAPEWIIYLTRMNDNDMRIIIQWLLLDPPPSYETEETTIRSLMTKAKQYCNDDDLHNRLELIISKTYTVEDITTMLINWEEDQIPEHVRHMCEWFLITKRNIDRINSIVETNWNNNRFKDIRRANKLVRLERMGIVERNLCDNFGKSYSESEEFVPSSEFEEYAMSSITTQHTLLGEEKVRKYS